VTGKRTAHERFPQVIAAAVRVFTRDGCKSARMSDVAREAGLSEAALYRHALLLEVMPAEHFPLKAPCLREMIERSARELPELADLLNQGFRAPVVCALTAYLDSRAKAGKLRATPDTAAATRLMLETLTWFARHRFSDPRGAAITSRLAEDTAIDALLHALIPPRYLGERP
jgi:tetracycline repressor-like protein